MRTHHLLNCARRTVAVVAALAAALAVGGTPAHAASTHQVVVYYQTQYDNGTYVSPLPLVQNNTGVTDVIVAAIHLDSDGVVHLNDKPPAATRTWRATSPSSIRC